MRREWGGWIRSRQWDEFEKLAKQDPSQALADTVAELELGFPEKSDRRALRKVLYLLAQSGYEPRELEESTSDSSVAAQPIEVAFMVSPDGLGDTVITYGREDSGRVAWLVAHMNRRSGVTRAVEETTTVDEAITKLIRLRNMKPEPYVSAEVPVRFALERLAARVASSKTMLPVMAYWRASLPREISDVHPAESLPRSDSNLEELDNLIDEMPATQAWRLELGLLAPTLTELYDERVRNDPEAQLDKEHSEAVMTSSRRQLFNDDTLLDHWYRLLDLAYLMHLQGSPIAPKILSLADNLKESGPESKYARRIFGRSLLMFTHTLRARNAKDRARVSEREASE